ncbi:MAG TPA: OsmC family peroxiredoxin [Terriglobales bacterium]|nr:OsmC family peroxiredoxin [Terriglobales bacterium]
MIRSAVAVWRGGPGAGEGSVSTSSGVISNALYSFVSSTGNEPCTNPSEMLAAAVASCISLMITQEMAKAGLKDDYVKTEAVLTLAERKMRWEISGIQLNVTSSLAEADAEKFQRAVRSARAKCPISRSLKVPIKMTAKLVPLGPAVAA